MFALVGIQQVIRPIRALPQYDKYIYYMVASAEKGDEGVGEVPSCSSMIKDVKADADATRKLFETSSLGSPESAIGFVLWRVVAHYQREADRSLAALDLTNLQFVTLALIAWFAQSNALASQAELARFGGIQPMQMSQMLKALELKSFVFRPPNDSDTRAKRVVITRSGLKVLRKALPVMIELQSRLFGEDGRPGGRLHSTILDLDQRLNRSASG